MHFIGIGANFDNVLVEDLENSSVLLWDDFNDGDAAGWTVIDDEGTQAGSSAWSIVNGSLVQTSNVGNSSSTKLGTFAFY